VGWFGSGEVGGGEPATAELTALRVTAIAAALAWGVLFFGVIDLLVVPDQDEQFYDYYLLETGWGLLYTVLVMVPLVVWAVRPNCQVFAQQVMVVAGAVLVCGLVTPAVGQIVVAFLLAVSVLVPTVLGERPLWPVRGLSIRGTNWWLGAFVVVAMTWAVVYAVQMIEAAPAGKPDDDTWGLMHLPMQAAFALAVGGSATLSVLAGAASAPGWKASAMPASVSAVWLGAVSVAYPSHLGSMGQFGGIVAIIWGLAFAAVATITRTSSQASHGRAAS
jgi:hypothetical protein